MHKRLTEYRQAHGLQSDSAALVELAAKGLGIVNPVPSWGGDRKTPRARLSAHYGYDFGNVPESLIKRWYHDLDSLDSDYDPATHQDLNQEIREYFNRPK